MAGKRIIPLSKDELAGLIRASADNGEAVSCAFGAGGAALIVADCPQGYALVKEWRGQTFNNGGGI